MMAQSPAEMTDLELVKELGGDTCRCGSLKRKGHTFCHKCYGGLAKPLQLALYSRLGKGYRQAYEAACDFLNMVKEWK